MPVSDDEIREFVEPCGSMRILATDHGYASNTVWCNRTAGPCPYPGTNGDNDRDCTGPHIMKVKWAEAALRGSLERLSELSKRLDGGEDVEMTPALGESLWPAIDALRACLPPEDAEPF